MMLRPVYDLRSPKILYSVFKDNAQRLRKEESPGTTSIPWNSDCSIAQNVEYCGHSKYDSDVSVPLVQTFQAPYILAEISRQRCKGETQILMPEFAPKPTDRDCLAESTKIRWIVLRVSSRNQPTYYGQGLEQIYIEPVVYAPEKPVIEFPKSN